MSNKLFECVPNYSEGRDEYVAERILDHFRGKNGIKLLDYQMDPNHNRLVVTLVGEAEPLKRAVVESWGTAINLIDMRNHEGQHPRMGAVDVCPFVPCRNTTIQEADALAKEVAKIVGERYGVPCFLYGASATAPHRADLSNIREGEFEGMANKMRNKELWTPDFGPSKVHPTAGVSAIGARMPLIAFNVNLGTDRVEIAKEIARKVRGSNGGYNSVKAIGVMVEDRNIAQVSMYVTDYTKTSLYSAFEAVKMEAKRYGVPVLDSEIVGSLPMRALTDCAEYYLHITSLDPVQIMENGLLGVD